jgi:hypothetical protein
MPMDRLTRNLAGLGLALIAAAGGCRSAHDEVPPGKVYRPDTRADGQVGFSTTPAVKANGLAGVPQNLTQGNLGGGGMFGSQAPGGDMTGTVPGGRFGAPGTSGAAMSPTGAAQPATGGPLSGLGQAPPLGGTSGASRPDATYLNGFPNQPPATGAMGSAGAPPSPL